MRTAGARSVGVRSVSLPEGSVETQSGAAGKKTGGPPGVTGGHKSSD